LALQIEIRCLLPLTLPRALSARIQLPNYFAQVFDFKDGAGEGNRTLVISLEGCMTTQHIKGIAAKLYVSALNGIKGLRLVRKTARITR
jgi:hypothetical protein